MSETVELWQSVEHGSQLDDGPVKWGQAHVYPSTGANRRRILDRAHRNGIAPAPDGWLYEPHVVGALGLTLEQLQRAGLTVNPTLTTWTRIRWDWGPTGDAVDLDAVAASGSA